MFTVNCIETISGFYSNFNNESSPSISNDKTDPEKTLWNLANHVFSHRYKVKDRPALKKLYFAIKALPLNEDTADGTVTSTVTAANTSPVVKETTHFTQKKKEILSKIQEIGRALLPSKILQIKLVNASRILLFLSEEEAEALALTSLLFAEAKASRTATVLHEEIISYLPIFPIAAMDFLVFFYQKLASYENPLVLQSRREDAITLAFDTTNVERKATPHLFRAIALSAIRIKAINQKENPVIDNLCDEALKKLSIPSRVSANEQELLNYLNENSATTPLPILNENEKFFLLCEKLATHLHSNTEASLSVVGVLGAAHPELTERAKELLEKLVEDSNEYIGKGVASAIYELISARPELAEWTKKQLEKLVKNSSDKVQSRAVSAIETLYTAHQDPELAKWTQELLEKLAENSEREVHEVAIIAIKTFGTTYPEFVEWAQKLFEKLIENPNLSVRLKTVYAIKALSTARLELAEWAQKLFAKLVGDKCTYIQGEAIAAIGELKAAHPELAERAKELLEKLAGDSNPIIRRTATSAVEVLISAHPALAKRIQKLLEKLAGDSNETVRWAATSTIKTCSIAYPELAGWTKGLLEKLVRDESRCVRGIAIVAIRELSTKYPGLTEWAKEHPEKLIEDSYSRTETSVIKASGTAHPELAEWKQEQLEKLAGDSDPRVQKRAISAIEHLFQPLVRLRKRIHLNL